MSAIPISNITDLQKIGNDAGYPLDGDYVLTQNIDARATASWNGGAGFAPIGTGPWFTGSFDGQGFTISNLTINRPSAVTGVGLFDVVWTGAIVQNLGIVSGSITGGDMPNVGGLAGDIHGTAENCFSRASVSSIGNSVGGFVGCLYGTLTNCYATGNVSGYNGVGGLIGEMTSGIVTNCYSTGTATASSISPITGGLISYGTGTIANSYWDTETSGQSISEGGGTGKTTAEMQDADTFTGWDFDEIWIMTGYPYLRVFPTHALTYTAGAHGHIDGDAIQVVGDGQDGTTVTAVADPGYRFKQWNIVPPPS
jgi:hypothetical protein